MAQTKPKALRELTDAELEQKVREAREELANLQYQAAVTPPQHPHRLKLLRKDVARCLTVLRQRQATKEKQA